MKIGIKIFFIAICFNCVNCLARIDLDKCTTFATTCSSNSNNVYIASLDVGTGECHVVRKGKQSTVIDAGLRFGSKHEKGLDANINDALKRLLSVDGQGNMSNGNLTESSLQAIFITHPHDDHHKKLLEFLMSMHKGQLVNSKLTYKIKLFLGGIGSKYDDRYGVAYGDQLQNCGSSHIIINDVVITYRDIMKDSAYWNKESDVNGHGAVFFVEYKNKTAAFLGDANAHSLHLIAPGDDIANNFGRACVSSSHLSRHTKEIWEKLISADILTVPHHASFESGEYELYSKGCLKQKDKKRIFIASASPEKQGDNIPRITNLILKHIIIKTFGEAFKHKLSYYDEKTEMLKKEDTEAPIFSTYDAPGGFVWTKIDAATDNGNVFINSEFSDGQPVFKQVLQ